jgi:hypothetical protein
VQTTAGTLAATVFVLLVTTAATVGLFAGAASAIVGDFSDLWWNAAESGWGMQLVRGGDATFATLYVYDAKERPLFYTATLSAADGTWRGTLYETTGPHFGAASFDPGRVTVRSVGAMTFVPANSEMATLTYTVDGTSVTKSVTRQTLRIENMTGAYGIATQRTTTHCPEPAANVERTALESATVVHAGSAIAIDWIAGDRACRLTGTYMQAGRLGAAQTSYACSDGEAGDMALFELQRRDGFLTGRFQGHAITNGCDYRGRVSAFVPE